MFIEYSRRSLFEFLGSNMLLTSFLFDDEPTFSTKGNILLEMLQLIFFFSFRSLLNICQQYSFNVETKTCCGFGFWWPTHLGRGEFPLSDPRVYLAFFCYRFALHEANNACVRWWNLFLTSFPKLYSHRRVLYEVGEFL